MLYLGIDQHRSQLTVNLRLEDGTVLLQRQVIRTPRKGVTRASANSPIGCLSTHHRRHRKSRAVEVQRGGIEERIGFRGLRDFGVTRPAESCPSQSHGGRREETNLATTATPSPMSPACSSSAATARKTRSPNLRVDGTDNEASMPE